MKNNKGQGTKAIKNQIDFYSFKPELHFDLCFLLHILNILQETNFQGLGYSLVR